MRIDNLKITNGPLITAVNIPGAGRKPKQEDENSYRFLSHNTRTSFLESMCNGTLKYASF